MLELANSLRKFLNYESVKLFNSSPWWHEIILPIITIAIIPHICSTILCLPHSCWFNSYRFRDSNQGRLTFLLLQSDHCVHFCRRWPRGRGGHRGWGGDQDDWSSWPSGSCASCRRWPTWSRLDPTDRFKVRIRSPKCRLEIPGKGPSPWNNSKELKFDRSKKCPVIWILIMSPEARGQSITNLRVFLQVNLKVKIHLQHFTRSLQRISTRYYAASNLLSMFYQIDVLKNS